MNKVQLPNVTLWAASWSQNDEMLKRTLRVLKYCLWHMEPADCVLFHHLPVSPDFELRRIQIGQLDWERWNIWVNTELARHIKTEYALCIHEDGFPIRWDLWQPEFLEYDYIGAPWLDGVVGNGGFFIESRRMLEYTAGLPITAQQRAIASDMWVCRNIRQQLEKAGFRWAPASLAAQFSTETTNHNQESFGYHGRRDENAKYVRGWNLIGQWHQDTGL